MSNMSEEEILAAIDNDDSHNGDEDAYDGEAVEFYQYDNSQFELDEDFEVDDDDE